MDALKGKRTYILVSLALVAGLANYVSGVVQHGFSLGDLVSFVNGEAATAAIAALRASIGKK